MNFLLTENKKNWNYSEKKRVSGLALHKYGPYIVYQEQADIVEW
jgi:UDP-galactopyranose mutase